MAISHLSCCQGSWSISPAEFVTPGIPACRQSFIEVYRVKTRQKGRVAKRKEGVKGLKGKGGTRDGDGDGVRRRAEDKTGGIKRARPSVWTHESQILRRAGACMMFLFTGAPTRPMCPPSPCLQPRAWWTRLTRSLRSSGSRTVPRLSYFDVMWSFFYKTAFLQRRTPFVMAVRFPFTPDPLVDYHPHFMGTPARVIA